jgi:hypothetical protein
MTMLSNNVQPDVDVEPLLTGNTPEAVLKDLQAQVRIMSKMNPRLSELTKLYQARKSRIDQFVEWYTDAPWWGKLLEGGLVVSVAYTVGAFVGVAWLLTGLVTALYVVAISIMEEHAAMMKARNTSFMEDIQKMEASIAESMDSFRLLEGKLNAVFQSLVVLHDKRSEGITSFEDKNLRYASIIDSLSEMTEKLSAHQGEIALTEVELKTLSEALKNNLHEAKALCEMLSTAVSSLEQPMDEDLPEEFVGDVESEQANPSVVEQADKAINGFNQRLDKLRQARYASKNSDVTVSNKVGVVSTALYDFM